MTQKLIILNQYLSGVNKYIFNQLNRRGWNIDVVNVPFPPQNILKALILEFNLNIFQWRQNAIDHFLQSCSTSETFVKRTIFCQKNLEKLHGKFDLIFQISGMFAPTINYEKLKVPYVTFNDYTMSLSLKYPSTSSPPTEIQKWLELEKNLYQNASKIFTTSENTKKSLIDDYNIESKRVIVVRYGIPIEFEPKAAKSYTNKTILFIGRNFKQKGGFILLKAFQKVRNKIPNAKLLIVGVDKNIIRDKISGVEILGFIKDRNRINDLYEKSTIFVMLPYSEAFGLVFLEAMIHKLPCIGTNIDAIPEIILDGKTGFLIHPDDIEDLANKIIILLENPDLSKKMGILGYERAIKEYSWEDFGKTIDKNLRDLI
jgi:glycosyltransferase involved in cell wall biosynthesis